MACTRCGGFLVIEAPYDFWDQLGSVKTPGTRCLNCGDVEDWLIRMNRTAGSAQASRLDPNTDGSLSVPPTRH